LTNPRTGSQIPLIVLAGSDPEPARLPEKGSRFHALKGAKALNVKVAEKPIIDLLLERLRASGHFAPIFIAGPASLLGDEHGGATVIDTNGTFGENLRAAVDHFMGSHPRGPLAFTTCDILPELDELDRVMADFRRRSPIDFWFPVIQAPPEASLGASSWKPRYRMIPEGSEGPESMLPGHLVIVDPWTFRLPLIYRSFQLAYQTRNTAVMRRLWRILSGVLIGLVGADLSNLARLRLPMNTVTAVWHGIALALELRGVARQEQLEKRIGGIFVLHRHRRKSPDLAGRIPLMDALSLAKDIDTQEEADEARQRFSQRIKERLNGLKKK
jgi:hypothetical protein